ncbi:MAG TPA: hypothetical protein VFS84_16880, partial [Candidatus Binatia bacterium]|nr:hypothetical protein [Candidatus Binatia bacterium]
MPLTFQVAIFNKGIFVCLTLTSEKIQYENEVRSSRSKFQPLAHYLGFQRNVPPLRSVSVIQEEMGGSRAPGRTDSIGK